jgi:bifunctional DNase/RNase
MSKKKKAEKLPPLVSDQLKYNAVACFQTARGDYAAILNEAGNRFIPIAIFPFQRLAMIALFNRDADDHNLVLCGAYTILLDTLAGLGCKVTGLSITTHKNDSGLKFAGVLNVKQENDIGTNIALTTCTPTDVVFLSAILEMPVMVDNAIADVMGMEIEDSMLSKMPMIDQMIRAVALAENAAETNALLNAKPSVVQD